MTLRVLIAGCGDVGCHAGRRLARDGHEVSGLRRSRTALPAGITPVRADLLDPASLRVVAGAWDAIVYAPTPGQRDEVGYRNIFVDGLRNLLAVARPDRLVYVSSTAVYGQEDGSWVDEASETAPGRFNGQVLLEGERQAAEAVAGTLRLRLAGIYGPGRDRMLRLAERIAGGELASLPGPSPGQWTNRIHRDDAGALVAELLAREAPAGIYNGVDDRPSTRREVLSWLCGRMGLAPPTPAAGEDAVGGKRVSNRKIRALGFEFRYPDFEAGYGALVNEWEGQA